MHSGLGPINAIPCCSQISANFTCSDNYPYPGALASAPLASAAAVTVAVF